MIGNLVIFYDYITDIKKTLSALEYYYTNQLKVNFKKNQLKVYFVKFQKGLNRKEKSFVLK